MTRPTLKQAFSANRRPAHSPGYWRPASEALKAARFWLGEFQKAEEVKAAASEALKAARAVDGRQYAPGMVAARDQLAKANSLWQDSYRRTHNAWPMRGNGSSLGAAFQIGGFRSALGQWCEVPPFRYAGAAHEILKLDHTGYFLDPYGHGETIHGGVYQATARDGRARFIPAMPDPHNSGPAILALGDMVTAADSSEDAAEQAKRDAARRADQLASYYAEAERDYQEAHAAGREAREKAQEATAAGKAWVAAVRAVRKLYRARHGLGIYGLPLAEVRKETARAVALARTLCNELQDAREAARAARGTGHGWTCANCEAWRDGYAEGPL